MIDFESMMGLPPGRTLESVITESFETVEKIGLENARFSTITVAGVVQVVTNPKIEHAWKARDDARRLD